jgi:hypothetical protein
MALAAAPEAAVIADPEMDLVRHRRVERSAEFGNRFADARPDCRLLLSATTWPVTIASAPSIPIYRLTFHLG